MQLRIALLALVAWVGACADPWPTPATRWQSEHFVFRSEAEAVDPEGSAAWFESHFAVETALFGTEWPRNAKIDYRRLMDADEVRRLCISNEYDATACERDARVLTTLSLRPHELIHAYLASVGSPPAAFAEGMAMIYGCVVEVLDAPIAPTLAPDALFGADFYSGDLASTKANYLRAASFVSFLVDEFGLPPMLRLYGQLPHDADTAAIDHVLRTELGVDLGTVLDRWVARGPVGSAEYCRWPEASLFPALAPDVRAPISFDATQRVSHDETTSRLLPLGAQRSLSIPASGVYRIEIDAVGIVSTSLLPSGSTRGTGFVSMLSVSRLSTEAIVELAAGEYWLDLSGWNGEAKAQVRWQATLPMVGAGCADVNAISLPAGLSTKLVTWHPPQGACDARACRGWLAFEAAVDTTMLLRDAHDSAQRQPTIRMICDRTCGACTPAFSSEIAVPAGRTTYVQWEVELGGNPSLASGAPLQLGVGASPNMSPR